ncbi:hypothetical protein UlMin_000385 [Ulmus minor]
MATSFLLNNPPTWITITTGRLSEGHSRKIELGNSEIPSPWQSSTNLTRFRSLSLPFRHGFRSVLASSSYNSPSFSPQTSTKLYVSGLSFRTTEDSLRNAFQKFGQLVEVNLVMDKIAKRPRGFAFLRYATEEESQSAIEGMHGKFLDGRVIFVEVAKPRSELRQSPKQDQRRY